MRFYACEATAGRKYCSGRKVFALSIQPKIMVIHAIPTYPQSACLLEIGGIPTGIPILLTTVDHKDRGRVKRVPGTVGRGKVADNDSSGALSLTPLPAAGQLLGSG